MIRSNAWRRFAKNACVLAATACVVMIGAEIGAGMSLRSFPDSNALAAPAGTAPNGSVTLSPATGPLTSAIGLSPDPAPAFCPGDSVAGYRWQTFISAAANDPATFVYDSNGPTVPGGGVAPTFPLVSSTGINQVNRNTAADTGAGGQITPIPGFDLGVYGALLSDGDYSIGFACSLDGQTVSFWTTQITIAAGSYSASTVPTTTSTTTSTTVADGSSTTSTTVAGGTTTTTVAGGTTTTTTVAGGTTTTTTVAGGTTSATVTPSSPTPGGAYSVAFPNCSVGETITFRQSASTPATVTDVCEASSALSSGSIAGLRMPAQATTGTATGSFTAAPTAAGSYTVTMTGTVSAQRTVTFVIVGASTPPTGGGNSNANTGGSPTSTSTGTIPSTGSSTTALVVWGVLLLVFGRMAILLGRKPKVLTGT